MVSPVRKTKAHRKRSEAQWPELISGPAKPIREAFVQWQDTAVFDDDATKYAASLLESAFES